MSSRELSKEDCDDWRNSLETKGTPKGRRYGKNPKTGRTVLEDRDTGKKITKECDKNHPDNGTNATQPIVNTIITNPIATNVNNNRGSKTSKKVPMNEMWLNDPTKDPRNGNTIYPFSARYNELYMRTFQELRKKNKDKSNFDDKNILEMMPKNHLLFKDADGGYDMLYFRLCMKGNQYAQKIMPANKNKYTDLEGIYRPLGRTKIYYEYNDQGDTIQKIEMKYCNQLVWDEFVSGTRMKDIENNIINRITTLSIENIKTSYDYKNMYKVFKFIKETYITKDDGTRILIFDDTMSKTSAMYKAMLQPLINVCVDLVDLVEGNVIENKENKVFNKIDDPIDKFFEKYEEELKFMIDPKYVGLIDLTTYKLVDRMFKSDEEYDKFVKDVKDKMKNYTKKLEDYNKMLESGRNSKSPTPPQRPMIKLPNGRPLMISNQRPIDEQMPKYVNDSVYKEFKKLYERKKDILEEYVKEKNKPLKELLKKSDFNSYSGSSSSKKRIGMSRDEIVEKHLYSDMSPGNKNRCSESVDYLTNEEFEDSNYPLAKLQLMVKLKFKDSDNKLIRTDCVYAPVIYNQMVEDVNKKKPLMSRYKEPLTDEHVKQIMRKMKLIDKNIEVPVFIKPIHDTKLMIEQKNPHYVRMYDDVKKKTYNQLFIDIVITRKFGSLPRDLITVCSIPDDINVEDTGSTDLTSSMMMFRIFKLFNDGRLLHSYVPPYGKKISIVGYLRFNIMVHFNNIKTSSMWVKDYRNNYKERNRSELIKMFKSYALEVNDNHRY